MQADAHAPARPDPLMRIETARLELGETQVSQNVARTLVAVFLGAITLAPAAQLMLEPAVLSSMLTTIWRGLAPPSDATGSLVDRNRRLLSSIQNVDDLVADQTLAARFVRPAVQLVLSAAGAGTSQVDHGRDGWLFFAPDLAYVTGPGFLDERQLRRRATQGDTVRASPSPDPRPALIDLHSQLAQRGITLVVMPTPVKPSVAWMHLDASTKTRTRFPNNASHHPFVDQLRRHGLLVFDVAEEINAEAGDDDLLYLRTDTHWRPETVELVAARLAGFLREHDLLNADGGRTYRTVAASVTNQGDTARLLDLPDTWGSDAETVTLRQVVGEDGDAWRPDRTSAVLLLGDSFTNMYSVDAMGWGTGAGLAEQLSYETKQPIDRLAQNDDGAVASRELLATDLRRGRGRLVDKRVVILQFAARELAFGDWRPLDLGSAREPRLDTFVQPTPGQPLAIRGTIADIGRMPRPGTVPYRDHIVGMHLTDVSAADGAAVDGSEVLVYLWSMQDNEPTVASRYRVGDTVTLTLQSWEEVAGDLEGINRDEVADPRARVAAPWWALPPGVAP